MKICSWRYVSELVPVLGHLPMTYHLLFYITDRGNSSDTYVHFCNRQIQDHSCACIYFGAFRTKNSQAPRKLEKQILRVWTSLYFKICSHSFTSKISSDPSSFASYQDFSDKSVSKIILGYHLWSLFECHYTLLRDTSAQALDWLFHLYSVYCRTVSPWGSS